MKRPPFPTRADLICGWMDLYSKRAEADGHWAEFLFDDIVSDFPEEAWSIILELMDIVHGTDLTAILAAGALENLLVRHGRKFIEQIEDKAKSDEKFRHLLSHIWQQGMEENMWRRIQALRPSK